MKSTRQEDGDLDGGGPHLWGANVVERRRAVVVLGQDLIDVLGLAVELLIGGTDGVTGVDLGLRPTLTEWGRLCIANAVGYPAGRKAGVANTTG